MAAVSPPLLSTAPRRGSLFVSYARDDDEAFVARLHDDLTELGFRLWWDRRCMPNRGLAFLREIRDAVDEAERLVLVYGPRAAESDYVGAEWHYACSIGTPVTTLLRIGDYEQLPDSLGHFDVLDFRVDEDYTARLETLVRQLEQPVAPLGRLVGVPELPPQFQPRSADLETIRAALLRDSREPVVLTAAGRRAGMQGMGGIGKSVLAAAVVRDFDVRRAFPDGLVWASLGAEPRLPVRLAEVCRAFGGAREGIFDAEQGRSELSELLSERASLLVLDDAWQLDHVRAFDALGPKSALLVTTRDERLLDELGATTHRLDVLSADDSLRLMAAWLAAPDAVVTDPDAVAHTRALDEIVAAMSDEPRSVARECGHLPLALALSAAQVRDGGTWAAVLEALQEADLQYLDHPNGSVFKSMQVGVDALAREDAKYAGFYVELAVFPEGAAIPEAAVATLWQRPGGLNRRSAEKLITILARRALIRLTGQAPQRTVGIHALQHDYLTAVGGDPTDVHAKLVDAYRGAIGGAWVEAADDGYIFQHLAYHLVGADCGGELCALLTSSPSWLEAQFRAGAGDTQFVTDLELAQATPAGREPIELVKLSAARHVVSHRVESYSDVTLETLVLLGRWREAISHARLRSQPSSRIRAFVRLSRAVTTMTADVADDLLDDALALAPVVDRGEHASRLALSELALALFDAGRIPDALETARLVNERHTWYHRGAHDDLIVRLAERERHAEAAAVARTLPDGRSRADELLYVARRARDAELRTLARSLTIEAVSEVRNAVEEADRDFGVAAGSEPVFGLLSVPFEWVPFEWRSEALQAAARVLGPEDAISRELWIEALDAAVRSSGYRDGLLKSLATELARLGETGLVLDAVEGSEYQPEFRRWKTTEIVEAAAEAREFETALAVAGLMVEPSLRAQPLAALASAMHDAGDGRADTVLSTAVALAEEIEPDEQWGRTSPYGSVRAQTLCMLAKLTHRIGRPGARELVDRALVDARTRSDLARRAEALVAVAQTMTRLELTDEVDNVLEEALRIAEAGQGSFWDISVMLAEIGQVQGALALAVGLEPEPRTDALKSIATALAKQGASAEARRAIDLIDEPHARSEALVEAASLLAGSDPIGARAFFEEALADHDWPLGFNLSGLAETPEVWTDELVERALSLIPHVSESTMLLSDVPLRVRVLQEFLPRLVERGSITGCGHLIDAAVAADVLESLEADFAEQAEAALAAGNVDISLMLSHRVVHDSSRSALLSRTAAALGEAGDPRALDVARSAGLERAAALEAVALARARKADPAAESILEEALAAGADGAGSPARDSAVRTVASALAALGDPAAALAAIQEISDERERVRALADVAPALLDHGRLNDARTLVRSIRSRIVRAWGYLVLAAASGDRELFEQAFGESETGSDVHDDASGDWIAALCETAFRCAADDDQLARRLFDAARAACDADPVRYFASSQEMVIVRALARVGWYADALAAARAVGPSRDLDFGGTRAESLGLVADALASAGRSEEARAAADEADEAATEAIMSTLSVAPMMPPDGFESQHRRRVDQLLADADGSRGGDQSTEEMDRPRHETDERTSEPAALDAPGLDDFLAALATDVTRGSRRPALASLKEATRIAGWTSRTWRSVSEAINA